jgi:hypothetical protein
MLSGFADGATPHGRQTRTADPGFQTHKIAWLTTVPITLGVPNDRQFHPNSQPCELRLSSVLFAWHPARLRFRLHCLIDGALIATTLRWPANALHCLGKGPDAFPHHGQMQAFADVKGIAVLSDELPSNSR